jgi:hypothetical protein
MVKHRFPEETPLSVKAENVSCELSGSFAFDNSGESEQLRVWSDFIRTRPSAFDGALLRLKSFAAAEGRAVIEAERTSFSAYITSRAPSFSREFPTSERADPLGLTVLLISHDNHLVVTQRILTAEQNPSGLYFVGGYAEPAARDGAINLFDEAGREVKEEIGAHDVDPDLSWLIGLAYDPVYCHPELFFILRSGHTAEEIVHLSRNADDRTEANGIFTYPFDAVLSGDVGQLAAFPRTWSFVRGINFARRHVETTGEL